MRIIVSRAEMIERAQHRGYLFGKSLRKGPCTHHDHWYWYCSDHRIAFITLSLGRHHAAVEYDLRTIHPDLDFVNASPLYRDLYAAIDRIRRQSADKAALDHREGAGWLTVRGISTIEGERLARQFADITGRYHRELAQLPPGVVSLQEFRRRRSQRAELDTVSLNHGRRSQ